MARSLSCNTINWKNVTHTPTILYKWEIYNRINLRFKFINGSIYSLNLKYNAIM
jgi:hypothetical protein